MPASVAKGFLKVSTMAGETETRNNRTVLRLWAGWTGLDSTLRQDHDCHGEECIPPTHGTVEAHESGFVLGPAFSLGYIGQGPHYLDQEIAVSFGWGRIAGKREFRSRPELDQPLNRQEEHATSGGLWSVFLRNRFGIQSSSFGPYFHADVGYFSFTETTFTDLGTVAFGIGPGIYFGDKVVLVEGTFHAAPFVLSPPDHRYLYDVRVGIDFLSLLRGDQKQPARHRPLPLPPPTSESAGHISATPPIPPPPPQRLIPPPPLVPPEPPRAEIQVHEITINQRIPFDFDRWEIKQESFAILDAVAEVLQNHPEIRKVQIQGHTDDVGTDEYNQRLSERRAEAVRQHLIAKGIDSARLDAIGFGRSKPLVLETSEEARARNRRTEFIIIERFP